MKGIVLKASAGTGKTYRLSLEYIAAILGGESYKDVLVMTFTRKATSEISERVILFLSKLYKKSDNSLNENLKELYPDLDLSDENIERVYNEILENRDRLKIFTIDGFFSNIFRNVIAPYLNIFSYEIIDDNDNQEVYLKCFEKIVENKNEFDKFKIFLQNRTERNMENYLDVIKNLIINRWKLTLINNSSKIETKKEYKENISIEKIISYLIEGFKNVKIKKADDKDLADYISTKMSWIIEKDESNYESESLKNWNEILKLDKCWDGRRVRTTKKIDLDNEIEILQKAFDELKMEISKKIFNTDILTYEKEILDFIENLYSTYDKIKFSEKRFTHNDISNYVFAYLEKEDINLLKDGKVTEYFKDIFDGNFKTVFIDEFQDTSLLQWTILKGIINSCEKLICVGDEKQSIYGWRGGEKALFENLPEIAKLSETNMSVSYRSSKNVVDFTNFIFENISQEYESKSEEKEENSNWNFEKVAGKSENLGCYEILDSSCKNDEESMLDLMLNSIEENFDGNFGGIGIISRSNSQLQEIASALSERKIPFVMESSSSIIFHRAIKPIYKFLKFMVNRDIFSFLVFLRDDIVKIGNREVKNILNNKEKVLAYFFRNKNLNFENEIEKDFDFKIENNLFEIFEKIKKITDKDIENKNLILDILEEFNITKYFSSSSDLRNIFEFLELSKEYSNNFDFYNSLKDEKKSPKFKQVSLEEKEAITLLTIHKSKGLEFDTVYYYNKESRGGQNLGIQFHIDFKPPFEEIENFIFVDKKYEKVLKNLGNEYKFLREFEIKQEQEEINNLYVALTRAKYNIFLVIDGKSNLLENIIPKFNKSICGSLVRNKKSDETETVNRYKNLNFLNSLDLIEKDIEECEEPNRLILIDMITEEKRRIGNAVHYYLEFIIKNLPEEHKVARTKTYSKFSSIIGEKRLKNLLDSQEFNNFFENNEIIFSDKWDYIYPEYEIYSDGNLKRIDRLMLKNHSENEKGEILIVDYKTGGINQEQLDEYVEIVKSHLEKLGAKNMYNVTGDFIEIKL